MKSIAHYIDFFLRISSKLAYLLLYTVLCCVSNAQEIKFLKINTSEKPYVIRYNNKKYNFCPINLTLLKDKKFPDICEFLFQFYVCFYAWPDIKTPSQKSFIIMCDNVAFVDNFSIFMIEELVLHIDKKTGKIFSYDAKDVIKYQCNREELSTIENLGKLNSSNDETNTWRKFDNLGASNMQRITNKEITIWKFGKCSFQVTDLFYKLKAKDS